MFVLLGLLFTEVIQWRRDAGYNRAVEQGQYELAAQIGRGERGEAARAYATPDEDFERKVVLLASQSAGGSAAGDALYNLANLYLRRAFGTVGEGDLDVVVPLVEQAKQHYRLLLTADPTDWDAKYNLSLALAVLPEEAAQESDEELNPERSERAISTIRVEEQLP
jgi:tetratricopeptide (TPR) repeat protein